MIIHHSKQLLEKLSVLERQIQKLEMCMEDLGIADENEKILKLILRQKILQTFWQNLD